MSGSRPVCPLCGGHGPRMYEEPSSNLLHPIAQAVAQRCGVSVAHLLGQERGQMAIRARYVAISLAKTRLELNISQLSRLFNRDRTAIRNALNMVRGDPLLQGLVLSIDSQLGKEPCPATRKT